MYRVGAGVALIVLALFLVGIVGIITTINGWFTPFANNWLVVPFKLNAGFSGIQTNLLNVLYLLDIAIMALFCTCRLWKGSTFNVLKKQLAGKGYDPVLSVSKKMKPDEPADFSDVLDEIKRTIEK